MRSVIKVARGAFRDERTFKWLAIGLAATAFNFLLLYLIVDRLRVPFALAPLVSAEVSITLRFLAIDRWVFGHTRPTWRRLKLYHLAVLGGFATWWSIANLLVWRGAHYLVASLLAIGGSLAINYCTNFSWIWSRGRSTPSPTAVAADVDADLANSNQRANTSEKVSAQNSRATRLIVLAYLIALVWSLPLWLPFGKTGVMDWGFAENQWEVRWKSVKEYHQWPAHNPWQGGGIPVNPSPGYLSIQSVATFVFGAKVGLSVFICSYLLLGVWGYYHLGSRLFGSDPITAFFLSVLGPASTALAFHLTAGHLNLVTILGWPALFNFVRESVEQPRSVGIKAGILFGLIYNETPFYTTTYGTVMFALGVILTGVRASSAARQNVLRFVVVCAMIALPLVLPVTQAVLSVAVDYQRVATTLTTFSAALLAKAYMEPTILLRPSFYVESMNSWWGSWEVSSFLGVGACLLWIYGIAKSGIRWFHVAAVSVFIFAIGNEHPWHPMYWLMQLPPFSSFQSFNRIRLFVHVFFSIGAAWGFHQALGKKSRSRWERPLMMSLAGAALIELLFIDFSIVRQSHANFQLPPIANTQGGQFYQKFYRAALPASTDGWPVDLPQYTRANIGIVAEPAVVPSQFRQPTQLKSADLADYRGEYYQAQKIVAPDRWSPNHITFSHLDPGIPLRLNFNRGSRWHNFGKPLFPSDRIVEFDRPFEVMPDPTGRVDLTYVIPGLIWTWATTVVALVLATCFCLYLPWLKTNSAS